MLNYFMIYLVSVDYGLSEIIIRFQVFEQVEATVEENREQFVREK